MTEKRQAGGLSYFAPATFPEKPDKFDIDRLTRYISINIVQMRYFMKDTRIQNAGLWELAVLSLLREGPMHPYEMQRLIKERHKDDVLVLRKGSLYHAINRLLLSQLIEVVETGRQGRRPERTTYGITENGRAAQCRWLAEIVATPRLEPSEFMAAVSFLVYLPPHDALICLEQRRKRLEAEIAGLTAAIKALVARVGRINLLESEYLKAMRQAELKWTKAIIADLQSGHLTWDLEEILAQVNAAKKSEVIKR
jgi:DNA-binding PadR family transcriptional regulator